MKMKLCPLALAALLAAPGLRAAEEAVTVKDNRVNIRGQATLHSEVVTQLKKGETVNVLEEIKVKKPKTGEPKAWLRIALPSNTPVWVFAPYVTNNVANVAKLNVRGGPGENFSVLARLDKGTPVKPLRTVGAWMEIEAPASAVAFIAAETVSRVPASRNAELLATTTTPAPVATTPAPVPISAPAPTPVVVETVPVKPLPLPAPAGTPTLPAATTPTPAPVPVAVAPTPAPTTTTKGGAPTENFDGFSKIDVPPVQPKRNFWERLFKGNDNAGKKPAKISPAVATTNAPPPVEEAAPGPVRVVTREGIVRKAWNVQAPSDYELADIYTGRTINYLYSTNETIPWAAVKGRVVLVTGDEAIDRRWPKVPVLRIESLKTVE